MTNETTAPVQSLHDQIMRLPCTPPKDANINQMLAYKSGHRDARHAAAELAAAHEAEQAAPVAVPSWSVVHHFAERYVEEYELDDGEGGTHTPTEFERLLILDAAIGLIDSDEFRALLSAAPTPPAQQPRNRHGVDAHYFHKKLGLVLRDFESFTPDELARTLARLARVADEAVLSEPEFAAPPAQQSQWVPVSVRLPSEDQGTVAVLFDDGHPGVAWATYWHGARTDFAQWTFPLDDLGDGREVTHWMPLPAAPGDTAAPEQRAKCGLCDGSGEIVNFGDADDHDTRIELCPRCTAAPEQAEHQCPRCAGTGYDCPDCIHAAEQPDVVKVPTFDLREAIDLLMEYGSEDCALRLSALLAKEGE